MTKPVTITNFRTSWWHAGAAWLWRRVLWMIFAVVLLIPKLNRLRKRQRVWNSVRAATGLIAIALLATAWTRGIRSEFVVLAAAMMLFALLAVPERQGVSIEARRCELGALVVVDGGLYLDGIEKRERVKLFVARDRLYVLDGKLRALRELPYQGIRTQSVESSGNCWKLHIGGDDQQAEFIYEGVFAEHFARVAAATVRSRLQRELPVLHG
jgi:hypothetical protein